MSSSNPPYPNFNGITYNSSFFQTTSGGLTQGQANLLYLRKTYADTATSVETFGAGISTDTLGSTSGTLSLGASDIINIGTSSGRGTKAVSINTSGTGNVNLGGNIGQQVQMFGTTSGLNFQFDRINNSDPLQTFNFMNTQTSGPLNIGAGVRLITGGGGAINIGTGSGATFNPINIGGTGSVTSINGSTLTIGNGFSTTNLNGTSIISNLAINNIDRATVGALTIAPTTATSLILGNTGICNTSNLGTFTSTGLLNANGGITTATLNNASPTGDISIGNTQVSATGNINIGTGLLRSSAINIGTGNASVIGIGGTGLTTIGSGGLTSTGLITANGGLTMGTGKSITLQSITGYAAPISGGLGFKTALSLSSTTATGGATPISAAASDLVSFTMPVGVYIFEAYSQCNTVSTVDWTFGLTSASLPNCAGINVVVIGGTQRTTFVVSNSTSATWFWGARGTVVASYAFMAINVVRIA